MTCPLYGVSGYGSEMNDNWGSCVTPACMSENTRLHIRIDVVFPNDQFTEKE